MSKRNSNNYFAMMEQMVECSCRAAAKLEDSLKNFDINTLGKNIKEMQDIEHEGDNLKHNLVEKLAKEFITPIEREDIMDITDQIDDVTDSIEDVLLKIYIFNIQSIQPKAIEFTGIIRRCCEEMLATFKEFSNFKKSNIIHKSIVEINRLEESGDAIYIKAVRELYTGTIQAVHATTWTEVYNCLEKCCDTCEHTADLVENVIMKNT